ncbi:MAG: molybdopterin molybdenumtransferase MoeA, partial [Alphaproteobacteria bacterium]|nr:molybdopterin molybdenumtransferase MoeA [Alphaproteobacteria bacterium]
MAQLSDDCFVFGGALMRADQALRILAERIVCVVARERRSLGACRGRILAA